MAITALHYRLYKELHAAGLLPQGGPILEIGEANWYGDVDPREFCDPPPESPTQRFDIAKLFYKSVFGTSNGSSIDFNGTKEAERFDLNVPYKPLSLFKVVINNGTAEHIFNIANVFKLMHDACAVGGLMIHDAPFTGWIDHGFYCLQPTLFWDLAEANDYFIRTMLYGTLDGKTYLPIDLREDIHERAKRNGLPKDALLLVVLEKTHDAPFQIPIQGVYAGAISQEAAKNWQAMR